MARHSSDHHIPYFEDIAGHNLSDAVSSNPYFGDKVVICQCL
jgi:hypothetical protein